MINLFAEYYLCAQPQRQEELDRCLRENASLACIDNFYVFVHNSQEQSRALQLSKYVRLVHVSEKRPTYGQLFALINSLTKDEDINVLANSDILFDSTLTLTENLDEKSVICLSRWNITHEDEKKLYTRLQYNPSFSQDSWIFRGKMKKELESLSFTTGRPGCDHALAHALKEAGYFPFNPCLTVKSYHVHKSEIRNYTLKDIVPGPYYYVLPRKWKEPSTLLNRAYYLVCPPSEEVEK